MVGLKTVWITIFGLFLLGACVPQTKQTECASNEAFNASLRTCVPVIGGTTSFIKVKTYSPALPISVYKNDSSIFPLYITVDNPYSQSYTIEWERVYFGTPSFFAGNTLTTSLVPLSLATEIGAHFITAKIVAAGEVVDSHTFQINVSDTPRPKVNSSTTTPSSYALSLTPSDAPEEFSFTVKNNGSVISGAGYTVKWTVTKNGVSVPSMSETDSFSNVTTTGTNTFYLGTSSVPSFDPEILGVGSYVIKAVVGNTSPGEIVDEVQWSVTVSHPALQNITSRNLYSGSSTPAYTTTVTAYNGIPYSTSILNPSEINFVPSGQTTRADFCVSVLDNEGTYSGDGEYVRVDYYLDNVTLVYSTTTSGTNKICLSDASNAVEDLVLLSNTSSTASQTHTLVARVFDEATNTEYSTSNLDSGLGTYPITWNLNVKPLNTAPTVSFTSTSSLTGISCSSAVVNSRSCTVSQDTAFEVGVSVTDDYYTPATDTGMFSYVMTLYRNGTPIETCTKSTTDIAGNTAGNDSNLPIDAVGPDYICEFTIDSYDTNGPVNPASYTWSVAIAVSDAGSPIPGATALTGTQYFYNLTVTEVNPSPGLAVVAQGSTTSDTRFVNAAAPSVVIDSGTSQEVEYLTEGDTLNAIVRINDDERDSHVIYLYLCTDFTGACTSPTLLETKTVTKTDSVAYTETTFSYTIPEDLLPVNTAFATKVDTYFKVVATDSPHNIALALSDSEVINVNIRNKNPQPIFAGSQVPTTTLVAPANAFVGFPITLDLGSVSDASDSDSGEDSIKFQWYIDADGGNNGYSKITGATSESLVWTPSNGITAGTIINIKVCIYDDNTGPNPLPADGAVHTTNKYTSDNGGANCSDPWYFKVWPNALALPYTGTVGNDLGSSTAIWKDTTVTTKNVVYSAYTDGTSVYIDKTVFDSTGETPVHDDTNSKGFQTVKFNALSSGTVSAGTVKDLSLVGTTDYLFVAYSAADDSTPSTSKMKLRRIDKRTGATDGKKLETSIFPDTGKFGYFYSTPTVTAPAGKSTVTTNTGTSITVQFTAALAAGDVVTIDTGSGAFNVGKVADAPGSLDADEYCAGASPCSYADNAARLAYAINYSTDHRLQGFSAYHASGSDTVTIYGAMGSNHLDANATIAAFNVGRLGKLVYDSTSAALFLPFIDMTTATTLEYARVLKITDPTVADFKNATVYTPLLSEPGQVDFIVNEQNDTQLIVGSIGSSGTAKIHTYLFSTIPDGITNATIGSTVSLFGGSIVYTDSLRISAMTQANQKYFVAAKVLTELPSIYKWTFASYDASWGNSFADTIFDDAAASYPSTLSIVDSTKIGDVSIQTSNETNEARLLVSSNASGEYNLYTIRIRNDGDMSCGLCVPVDYGTQELSESKRISTTLVEKDMTIGTAGNTANENKKDVLYVLYPVDSNSDSKHEPHMGIINTEVESIQSTTTDTTGTFGHRPPFVGSN